MQNRREEEKIKMEKEVKQELEEVMHIRSAEEAKGELVKVLQLNRVNFEKIFIAMQYLSEPLRLGKKMRVIIDYDPQEESTDFQYFSIDE